MTKGGVMIGSTVSRRSSRLARNPVRGDSSAKASPSTVEPSPTAMASSSEFHAVPQAP